MKRSFRTVIAVALATLCLCASADATVVTIDVPHAVSVTPAAINDSGQVTGYYIDHASVSHGFLRQPDGTLTTFELAGAAYTFPIGISATGVITGQYVTAQQQPGAFIRAVDGSITTFTIPNSFVTWPRGANAAGWSVGVYTRTANGRILSFLRDPSGAATEFSVPHARRGTVAIAVNGSQTIAGEAYFRDDTEYPQGFVRTADGAITVFNDTGIVDYVAGINDAGTVVGGLLYHSSGFVRTSDGTLTSFVGPNGAIFTKPAAINNSGTVVGKFMDTGGTYHSFIRTADGTFTPFDPVRSVTSGITAINNNGVVAGIATNKHGRDFAFVGTP